mmetsp:Transcript_21515/g.46285  ORF Transcript_21515/g.46285 Transcript_21515/m.46285 type:complete len:346 (-) Transcript_21515:272-1309(-)
MSATSVHPLCDAILTSDSRLKELYEDKGPLEGAFVGCTQLAHRETGVRYSMRSIPKEDLANKADELSDAIRAQRYLNERTAAESDEYLQASLARLHEVLASSSRLMLICELPAQSGAVCTDLLSFVSKRGRLPEDIAQSIFAKLVLAVKKAHEHSIVLRNLKPEAVQVRQQTAESTWEVHVADLNCSAITEEDDGTLTGLHGTPEYAAPEVVIWYWYECGQQLAEPPPPYGIAADAWALGVCLHVMLCGSFPFGASTDEEQMLRDINAADFKFEGVRYARLSASALDLMRQLLVRDPADRPCMEEVLQHAFCSGAVAEAVRLRAASLRIDDYDQALDALEDDGDD